MTLIIGQQTNEMRTISFNRSKSNIEIYFGHWSAYEISLYV